MATGASVRSRVRAEMIDEIKSTARVYLARDGANLSLRAVARDMGMVSSALYRYFPSRDDLLTALIIDAYNAIGTAAEAAEAAVARSDIEGRLLAMARAIRAWAKANPAEYALVYGSPVPGYVAPRETVDPASRVPFVLLGVLRDVSTNGAFANRSLRDGSSDDSLGVAAKTMLPPGVRADMRRLLSRPEFAGGSGAAGGPDLVGLPEVALARGIGMWTQLFGLISFELFGHLVGSVDDIDAFFDYQLQSSIAQMGIISVGEPDPA